MIIFDIHPNHSIAHQGVIETMRSRWTHNPYALMAILLVLWGSFAAVSKWTLQGIASWQMQLYFFGMAMVALLAMLPFGGRWRQLAGIGRGRALRLAGTGFVSYLYYVCYTSALKFIPAVEASMLNYLFPIAVVVFAVRLNREKMTPAKSLLIVSGLIGTVVIITDGNLLGFGFTNLWGDLLALAGALLWGLFSNLGKRDDSPLYVSVFVYVAVSFICSLFSLALFSEWIWPDAGVLAGIGWLSLSNVVLCYFIWFRALKISSAALVSGLSYLTPFVTLLFIVALLDESMSWLQLAGFLWILLSVYVQSRIDRPKPEASSGGVPIQR